MPVRFSITVYNLYEGNLAAFNPDENGNEGEETGTADRIFRHFTFGTDLIIKPNFNLRIGYNHLRRKELQLNQNPGTSGFSFGFMFRLKSFEMAYTRSNFNIAGGANNFTISSNLKGLIKNKNI